MTNPSPTRPQRAAESIYQIGFIRHFNVDLAQDPRLASYFAIKKMLAISLSTYN